ncbi:hypothetical protein AVEN_71730-1 [Araneus ventricosus]|uniref:Uncharacterized protein n=1 Tax=Araneus ventricosus TaxID=182803 RepID=A0A4Y2QD89_ARAVE|nr:hypothetical protein AVEN_71730-1 [Araneus ventricosus]
MENLNSSHSPGVGKKLLTVFAALYGIRPFRYRLYRCTMYDGGESDLGAAVLSCKIRFSTGQMLSDAHDAKLTSSNAHHMTDALFLHRMHYFFPFTVYLQNFLSLEWELS